jgi:RimJ/RimL family protein N-acetyltransferase
MAYICLPKNYYTFQEYSITSLREQDVLRIKEWRNDQIDVLRQKTMLTDEDQINYYHNVVLPSMQEKQPQIILFSFLLHEDCIGYGGLTNVEWMHKRAEISFLLATERIPDKMLYQKEFTIFLKSIKEIAFIELGLHRLFTETFAFRQFHINVLEANDFRLEGRLKDHVYINSRFVDSLIHGCLYHYYIEERERC